MSYAVLGRTEQENTVFEAEAASINSRRELYLIGKRCLDIALSGGMLIILFPVMVLIACLIRLDSPGPVIFSQKRVGCRSVRRGQQSEICLFTFYKFRTMYHGVDDSSHREFIKALINDDETHLARLQESPADGAGKYKMTSDNRITRLGRLLRKTSLDELPQLWNVLKGDMSLVGPRPPLPYEVEMYEPWHRLRLEARPGLTGLWQVTERSCVKFDEMVQIDIDYALRQSMWLDISILLRTPLAVLSCKGAS